MAQHPNGQFTAWNPSLYPMSVMAMDAASDDPGGGPGHCQGAKGVTHDSRPFLESCCHLRIWATMLPKYVLPLVVPLSVCDSALLATTDVRSLVILVRDLQNAHNPIPFQDICIIS